MTAFHLKGNGRKQQYTVAQVQGWRRIMREEKLKQKELAARVGVPYSMVSRMLDKEANGELKA